MANICRKDTRAGREVSERLFDKEGAEGCSGQRDMQAGKPPGCRTRPGLDTQNREHLLLLTGYNVQYNDLIRTSAPE